jgi:hypothetical protein
MGASLALGQCGSLGLCAQGGAGVGGNGLGGDNSNSGPRGKLHVAKQMERVQTDVGESGMVYSSGETKGLPDGNGQAKVPYADVYKNYGKAAEKSLSGEKVPPAYRKRVKDYFKSLE